MKEHYPLSIFETFLLVNKLQDSERGRDWVGSGKILNISLLLGGRDMNLSENWIH